MGKKGVHGINDGRTKMLPCSWETQKQGGFWKRVTCRVSEKDLRKGGGGRDGVDVSRSDKSRLGDQAS